ncbi:long-chain-acyl-CoA synthetase, partial [Marichromatium gracile]
GRIPKWAEKRFVTEVVRFDYDTEEPMRGPDGFCIKCDPNEVGEVISEILDDPSKPSQRFEGYADEKATKKKILRDVFKKGDMWFRTGDLMKKDALGYVYFIDRIGDTFRWKGENVATSEVSEALTVYPGVKEANVFGVTIPGTEGRAGMVSLVVEEDFDLSGFYAHVTKQLPR